MLTLTIEVQHGFATIKELLDPGLPPDHADQHGVAIHQGRAGPGDNAEALGHALFYLSTIWDLEDGVKLDITQTE